MLYDAFATIAIMMVLAMLVVALRGGKPIAAGEITFQLLLLLVHWLYFAYCWRYGRQTLGMRVWGVHLATPASEVSWSSTLIRYIAAWFSMLIVGAGFWSAIWHPARLTWHDQFSNTWLEHRR